MSNLIEEVSNKKAIVERKKGIVSPYNSLAYNMENEFQSQKSIKISLKKLKTNHEKKSIQSKNETIYT